MTAKLAIVAVGGNALIQDNKRISSHDQDKVVAENAEYIVDLIEAGWRVVVTHGNGPQVGFILRRSELAAQEVPVEPIDYAVADTQGSIGYMFQKALSNALKQRGIHQSVVTVVTQTLVSLDDPAFSKPSKPIGAFLDEKTALQRQKELGWSVMEDSGRGWRRCVASPEPVAIQELEVIRTLLDANQLVIACGGGGIPVAQKDGELIGVEAVIDKDRVSSLLATKLNADVLIIPTGVEQVAIKFGTPEQCNLNHLTLEQANAYSQAGEFGKGSMQPKVDAILKFLQNCPSGQGFITLPSKIKATLEGKAGTRITLE